jgi:hypothetical protein
MNRYLDRDGIGRLRRLAVVLGRINESEDDELAYAYYAANAPADAPYDRRRYSRAYACRAYGIYRPSHVERAVAMCFKAAGIDGKQGLRRFLSGLTYRLISTRAARLARANA